MFLINKINVLSYKFGNLPLNIQIHPKLVLADGSDPGEERKQDKIFKQKAAANTFESIAYELVEKRKQEGAAPVTIEKLIWIIDKKLGLYIGKTPVEEITPVKLLAALRRIEAEGLHETANRAKTRSRAGVALRGGNRSCRTRYLSGFKRCASHCQTHASGSDY